GKSVQADEPVFETANTELSQDQGGDLGNTEDQPNVEEASKHDWFKKPERSPTLDPDSNDGKQINFRPPRTWISRIAQAEKPPLTFDKLMSTPIDFSTYVLNNLKIENLKQRISCWTSFQSTQRNMQESSGTQVSLQRMLQSYQ
ncbi:hypothetical protein Tco_0037163, partial [Tanacetum coccineum]